MHMHIATILLAAAVALWAPADLITSTGAHAVDGVTFESVNTLKAGVEMVEFTGPNTLKLVGRDGMQEILTMRLECPDGHPVPLYPIPPNVKCTLILSAPDGGQITAVDVGTIPLRPGRGKSRP